MIDGKRVPAPPVFSIDAYKWPEFKALCKRLGIPWDFRTEDLTIHFPFDGIVVITHKYQGTNEVGESGSVEEAAHKGFHS